MTIQGHLPAVTDQTMVKIYAFDIYSHSHMRKFRDKWMNDLSCVVCVILLSHTFFLSSHLPWRYAPKRAVFLGGDESDISSIT